MFTLSVKTRGNSNPQGKQRVYFCCQEDDFEKYFESVSNEILEKQNCAVYYLEPSEKNVDLEELFSHLSQMQLFVMPVTTKLLTTKNRAIDSEFPFAIEKHIPVLPLMQEGGLEDVFNKKCGDLQFLDKTSRDETAISYEEKLDKFLSSVLVGDELAKKVRDAFDAYVFLSYRKKDRKYAQELMRLIHENDFCRDIAIWYDEFLTPGENFNDLIKQALEKSELFALAVTPNLVNEENYVKNVEYPMALKEGKKVLPAELVPTDSEELKSQYPGITDSTDAHDKEALSKALFDALEKIAIKENDDNPEHNFFIGLAYLNGIDVEVNHERAVMLITQAAENGVMEATEKLVSMYRNAEGVTRNYETAIKWQEKLVEQREKRYNETGEEQDCNYYISESWNLGDYWKELGKISKAKSVYQRMLEASEEAFERFKVTRYNRYIFVSYNNLGDICQAEGNLQAARECYEKALEISQRIAEETETVEARRDLSVSYERLGDIWQAEGNLQAARECYEKALEISQRIAEETETVEARRDLSVSYNKLGDICQAEGNLKTAREYYEKALEISKRIAEETRTIQAYDDLATSYYNLANVIKKIKGLFSGNKKKAKEYYKKAYEIWSTLAEQCPDKPRYAQCRDIAKKYI